MSRQIKDCPKCKAKIGWWEARCQSWQQYFNADGKPSHAADSHSHGRGGKVKRCYNCDQIITNCIEVSG